MRARRLIIALTAGLAITNCGATLAAASHEPIPVLGVLKQGAVSPYAIGWGTVRPKEISNGGDMSSVVVGIRWSTWGGSNVIGRGEGDYIPDPAKSNKGYGEVAVVVAFDLGKCQGHWAYRSYYVYFPKEHQKYPNLSICPAI
ncbi:MAG: hypothetical protein WA359_07995 [Acidimicrobiales bacterium]